MTSGKEMNEEKKVEKLGITKEKSDYMLAIAAIVLSCIGLLAMPVIYSLLKRLRKKEEKKEDEKVEM